MKTNTKLLIFLLFVLGIFSVISIISELDRRFFYKDVTTGFSSEDDHEIRYKEEYFEPDSDLAFHFGGFTTSGSGDSYIQFHEADGLKYDEKTDMWGWGKDTTD